MRSARDPEHPLKRPKDPYDNEANYRRPVSTSEVLRIALKGALCLGLGAWFKFASEDRTEEGAKLAIACGVALLGVGLIDLVYMRSHDIEQVFLSNRRAQITARVVLGVLGAVIALAGTLTYSA